MTDCTACHAARSRRSGGLGVERDGDVQAHPARDRSAHEKCDELHRVPHLGRRRQGLSSITAPKMAALRRLPRRQDSRSRRPALAARAVTALEARCALAATRDVSSDDDLWTHRLSWSPARDHDPGDGRHLRAGAVAVVAVIGAVALADPQPPSIAASTSRTPIMRSAASRPTSARPVMRSTPRARSRRPPRSVTRRA